MALRLAIPLMNSIRLAADGKAVQRSVRSKAAEGQPYVCWEVNSADPAISYFDALAMTLSQIADKSQGGCAFTDVGDIGLPKAEKLANQSELEKPSSTSLAKQT